MKNPPFFKLFRFDPETSLQVFSSNKYEIIGYYFENNIQDCLERNKNRKNSINKIGIKAKYKDLEKPLLEEGFDKIFQVKITDHKFEISSYEI